MAGKTLRQFHQSDKDPERQPLIDVHVSYERGSHPSSSKLARAVEIFTRNHIYVLNSALRCVEVRRSSRDEPITQSQYIGAHLVGGQLVTDDMVEMSYPFPRPGASAVFETIRGRSHVYHRTTVVTRVVLYLSIVTVTTRRGVPSWEEIVDAAGSDK
jgi:hypothetical protein